MSDFHGQVPEPTEGQMEMVRDRMRAFIFPNCPSGTSETTAFEKACRYQYEHEATEAEKLSESGIPEGVESFHIGDFSMTFEEGTNTGRLTRKTICPSAYGVLLTAGLLYRGVERG